MKNHWIAAHNAKKNQIWTTEFSYNGIFILKPRVARIVEPSLLGWNTFGQTGVIFKDAMLSTTDHELLDFLMEARKKMHLWTARFTHHLDVFTQIESFELGKLGYISVGSGASITDVEVTFTYKTCHYSK